MAVLKKLEDQLNCSICLDTYTNPKQLQCHHVYCQQCLIKLVVRDQQGQLSLTCPNCRQITPVPAKGVAGLQSAFQINPLLEIVAEHKKPKATVAKFERAESVSATSPKNITVCCPEHGGREVELYCDTCKDTICFKCIMKGEKHHSHKYEELNKAFEKYKGEITSSLEPLEKQLVTIEKALVQLDARYGEILTSEQLLEADIHKTIKRLHETLEVRKTELIDQLHQLTQAKLKSLTTQRDQIETTQAQLSSCLHFLKEILKTGNQEEVLMMKNTTVQQVTELTTTFQADMLTPNTEADMIFTTLADLFSECQDYGQISTVGPTDPSKCYATGKGTEVVTVGEESTANLQTRSVNNHPCEVSKVMITCELVSERTDIRVIGSVKWLELSQYEISYCPSIKGEHQLHIKIENQHIRGSPFPVTAMLPVEKLGIPILTIGGVKDPTGVLVNHNGEVVVSEWDGHCVSVFSPRGEKLGSFGGHSRFGMEGNFRNPHGLAIDVEGNIFVADCNFCRIQKFTAQGGFLKAETTLRAYSGILDIPYPRGIAFNISNSMVYVSCNNGSILILKSDLSYVGTFGERGSGNGQFDTPRHIACDSTGKVYVADSGNHRIQVFTAEGKFLTVFGGRGCGGGRGELCFPFGVAIDSSDRVYVGEHMNYRVSVFTSEGQFVTSFGSEGNGPGEFQEPKGLAVDKSGVLYVCDSSNRIQLF